MAALLALIAHYEMFVMVLCRTSGVFLAAPVLSSRLVPRLAKVLACGAVAVCLLPTAVAAQAEPVAMTWVGFGLTAAKELVVGLVLGFFALLAFTAVQVAGELLSEQMGFAISKMADPTTDQEMTVLARLATVLGMLLFVAADGHHWLLAALGRSFARLPVGGFAAEAGLLERLMDGFAGMFESGIVLAAPVFCVTLLTTVAIGVVARVVPQINALMISFPLRIGVGLMMLGASLPFIAHAAEGQFAAMGRDLVPLLCGR
ncbi:MAG: flagellar biosynthetic protein FliR [Candidatus Brocadiia bacterium]